MRKNDKRNESDKSSNYKNLIAQYYDRDPHLTDVKTEIKSITPEIDILDELNEFERKIDALIKTYVFLDVANAMMSRRCTWSHLKS